MSSPGGQPDDILPGYAVEIRAAEYRPEYPMYRHEKKQLASWFLRVNSAVVDFVLVGCPVAVPYSTMSEGHHRAEVIRYGIMVQVVMGLVLAVWEGRNGRSPGKALMRLRLVDEAGGRMLGFWRALGRRVAHLLDGLSCYLGFLWPLWDAQRQTFADKIAKAVVLNEGRRA